MRSIVSSVLLALILVTPLPAFGHRLNVYAWVENNNIIVECNFGNGRPARDAEIKILDSESRQEFVHGQTNEKGQYIFKIPDNISPGQGLMIEVLAGQGHRGEWKMTAADLNAASTLAAGFEEKAGSVNIPQSLTPATDTGITAEQIRGIVHEAMEAHLAPVRKQLAKGSSSGPGVVEIIGGIGWIVGIVGLVLYFRSRRKE